MKARFEEIRNTLAASDRWRDALPWDARMPRFVDVDDAQRERLRELVLLVIGTGAVGGPMALHAARLGVRELRLVDRARFKAESVLTSAAGPDDIGAPKASCIGKRAKALSPATRVLVHDGPVEELSIAAFRGVDMVLLGTDNLNAEQEVSQICLHLSRPLLQASVDGSTLVAQVRSFSGQGACAVCNFSTAEWEALDRDTRFSCDGDTSAPIASGPPTLSVSALCSLAADLALMQMLRRVLGIADPLPDGVLEYAAYTQRLVASPLARNPDCACDHVAWSTGRAPRALPDCTLRDLFRASGLCNGALRLEEVSVAVEGAYFANGRCTCGGSAQLQRFVPVGADAGRCAACGAPVRSLERREASGRLLGRVLDQPLGKLGLNGAAAVLVRGRTTTVLFEEGGEA